MRHPFSNMAMIKNLIFDLGGVILDLSVPQTIAGFSKLSGLEIETVKRLFLSSREFEAFERGEMDEQGFRDCVRRLYNVRVADEKIDECWNAMLLSLPQAKLDLLANLKKEFKTFLLSNTNNIHLDFINDHIISKMPGVVSLDGYFHKTYYSHRMKKRKPEPEIFLQVLDENGLLPEETLFLDDNAGNIEGANAVGLKTAFVNTSDFILDYFHEHRTA
jgi:glucose-1-phosphatase